MTPAVDLDAFRRVPLLRPLLRFLWRHQPDASFLVLRHRLIHGHFPNLANPRTINDKLIWRMLFDRRPILRRFVDKYEARAYVTERLGSDAILPKLIAVCDRAEELGRIALPERFVAKPSHGSRWLFFQDGTRPLDRAALVAQAGQWLATDYYTATREWAYKGIRRRVLIEEHLGEGGEVPTDYKILCFGGRATYFQVMRGRFTRPRESFYDRDWTMLPGTWAPWPRAETPEPRPARLGEMIEIAEALSAGMDFLRVDLYHLEKGVRFGELTPYPSGAQDRQTPMEWQETLGRHWTLDRRALRAAAREAAEPAAPETPAPLPDRAIAP